MREFLRRLPFVAALSFTPMVALRAAWLAFGYVGFIVLALIEYLKLACYFEVRRSRVFLVMAFWLGLVSLSIAFLFVEISIHGPGPGFRREFERRVVEKIERDRQKQEAKIQALTARVQELGSLRAEQQGLLVRALRIA